MNKSAKLFIASIVILACSVGFFLGAFSFSKSAKAESEMTAANEIAQAKVHKKHHKEKPTFKTESAFMDSILQITSEQKAALDSQRVSMDSSFKAIYKQKKDAEKELRSALVEKDSAKLAVARAAILKTQESMLDLRIQGVKNWHRILTKEQIEKFNQVKKEHQKNFKKHWKKHAKHEYSEAPSENADF